MKECQGIRDVKKCQNILTVGLFHSSTPLRSVKLGKERQRFRDQGKRVTLSLLCQTFPHFHTSEKCGTK